MQEQVQAGDGGVSAVKEERQASDGGESAVKEEVQQDLDDSAAQPQGVIQGKALVCVSAYSCSRQCGAGLSPVR